MRRPVALLFVAALAAAPGCRSCDAVESELRHRETDVRELREDLDRCEAFAKALQQENNLLRSGAAPWAPDAAAVAGFPLRTLTLGRQTGGREIDGVPGDGALQVVLEPRDADGQTVKVPASALVQVLEIMPEGQKRPLFSWEVSQDELTRSWRTGFLTTGYVLIRPWKVWPSTDKLRVIAVLRLADGRTFEADKDLTVRIAPAMRRKMPPATGDAPPPAPAPAPVEGPELPLPRPVGPEVRDKPTSYKPPVRESGARRPWWDVPVALPPPAAPIPPAANLGRPIAMQ